MSCVPAKRLVATAMYGTNGADGYTNGAEPMRGSEPVWVPPSGQSAGYYESDTGSGAGPLDALVTTYAYDAAGRRTITRDPRGIRARTWYDLVGNTLLEAENYPEDCGNLTSFEGPVRYTAYHYTRGGLLDAIVLLQSELENAAV